MTTTILYRPVGPKELEFIKNSGWMKFPVKLSKQPIFYPVTKETRAIQLAKEWNTKGSASGYVTKFAVLSTYLEKFDVQQAEGSIQDELCVSADELEVLNAHIVGNIEVTQSFHAKERV